MTPPARAAQAQPIGSRLRNASEVLPWAALALLTVVVGLQKIRSFDYWWHLRTGQWIAETGSVPRADPFSFTAHGAPWIDIHWLFQWALHGVHSLGGHEGVSVARALVVLLIVLACAFTARHWRPGWLAASLLALLLLVAADRFLLRPELLSFLLLALLLLLFDREARREGAPDRWFWAAIPIQLVWVNVHGLFALGIALCGLFLAGELVRPLTGRGRMLRADRVRRLAGLGAVFVALALANPNGWHGAVYPLQQLAMIGTEEARGLFGMRIEELLPPLDGLTPRQPFHFALVVLLAGLCLGAMGLNARQLVPAHVLVFVAFAGLGLSATRNLALFAIVAAPIAIVNAGEFLGRQPAMRRLSLAANVGAAALLVLAAFDVASGRFYSRIPSRAEAGLGIQAGEHALEAVRWIARERPDGPIANHMADGGLMIALLHPDYRVMVDGRLEVYGEALFEELTIDGPERLRALDARYGLGAVLVRHSLRPPGGLLWALTVDRTWRLVHLDERTALFVRADRPAHARWPELDVSDPAVLAKPEREPAPRRSRYNDLRRRTARVNLFLSLRQHERVVEELERLLEHHPGAPPGPGTLRQVRGYVAQTTTREQGLERRIAQSGGDARLLTALAELKLENGRLREARQLLERALSVEPLAAAAAASRARLAEAEGDAALARQLYARILAAADDPGGAVAREAAERLRAIEEGVAGGSTSAPGPGPSAP